MTSLDWFFTYSASTHTLIHTHILSVFLFNRLIFPELLQVKLLQVRPVPESKLQGTVVAELLQAGCPSWNSLFAKLFIHILTRCPSCRPTNSIKALKDDSVSEYGQHADTMLPRYVKNTNDCVGYLSVRLQKFKEASLP